ncbi:MAG: putative toxin-antitoxin system toxin component, PIN family [Nitrospirota bacterium]
MKKVFDTNVLHVTRSQKRQFNLTTCPFILHEFDKILTKKFSATKQEKENAVALITEAAQDIVAHLKAVAGACRDKDDDNILACALEAGADYLVTGDKDLLQLKLFKGIRIIAPRDFESLFDR